VIVVAAPDPGRVIAHTDAGLSHGHESHDLGHESAHESHDLENADHTPGRGGHHQEQNATDRDPRQDQRG